MADLGAVVLLAGDGKEKSQRRLRLVAPQLLDGGNVCPPTVVE
jgi:hypothetical protein